MSRKSPLDGTWELVRAELDGERAPELPALNIMLHLHEGGYAVRFNGQVSDRGSFEVGGTQDQPTIVMRGVKGPNAGRIIPCIYRQAGNRLRICYGLGGVAPTDFRTSAGLKRYLAVYRRLERLHAK